MSKVTEFYPHHDFFIEAFPHAHTIESLYVAYYGRPAALDSLQEWETKIADTEFSDEIVSELGNSEEYLALLPDDPAEIINDLYQRMFDRDVGGEGLSFYLGELDSGDSTLASLPLDILNGAQNVDVIAVENKTTVATVFSDDVMVKDAPYDEYDFAAGRAVIQVAEGDMESVEYGVAAAIAVVDRIVSGHGEFFPPDFIPPDPWIVDFSPAFDHVPAEYLPDPFPGYSPDVDVL